VLLQATLTPGLILVAEALVEATDGTGDFEPLPLTFGPLPQRISCARASHEHPRRVLPQCEVRNDYTGQTLGYGNGLPGLAAL
jgi:hypothetical protein